MKNILGLINHYDYKKTLFLLLILALNNSYAQELHEQIAFKVDNDKFVFQDKYYTNGLFVSYKRLVNSNVVFTKKTDNKIQVGLTLGNETYTPKNTSSFNINEFDRPYAGWLFGNFEIGLIKQKSALFLAVESGVTGKESLAGKLQIAFHDFLDINSLPTWVEEIEFKWLFNIKASYVIDWQLGRFNAFQYQISSSLGTKDVFLENGLNYFFGKFNTFKNSSRIGVVDQTIINEFYGIVSLGYKYVAHNTLIEGSLFKEDELFTTNAFNHVVKLRLGCIYKVNKNTFNLIYNFNSKEALLSRSHIFGSFIYARKF